MSKRVWIWLILVPALLRSHAEDFEGLNEAVGVNQSLEEGFGARPSGMAVGFPAFQRDADAVANAPASMNDVDDFTFSTSHVEKFGEAKFDAFAFLFPFESHSTLGLGISRYGISGIELWREGTDPLASQPDGVFSIADYLLVGAFARRWGGLDVGFNMNLIYRHLDQEGIGMRGDGMVQYTWSERFRLSGLMKGLIPSSASWESGYSEYEAPEVYLGGAARFPAPYFYGTLEAAWQSEGLFHRTARSSVDLVGSRAWDNPQEFLATSNLGLEFLFDFGLAVRLGVSEFSSSSLSSVATFGMGYNWRHILGLDYGFTPHPGLLSTHRISLQFTPSFPKFKGKDFRYRGAPKPLPARPGPETHPDVPESEIEEDLIEESGIEVLDNGGETTVVPAATPTVPTPAAAPAASIPEAATISPTIPATAKPAVPAVSPAPPPPKPAKSVESEVIEEEEIEP